VRAFELHRILQHAIRSSGRNTSRTNSLWSAASRGCR